MIQFNVPKGLHKQSQSSIQTSSKRLGHHRTHSNSEYDLRSIYATKSPEEPSSLNYDQSSSKNNDIVQDSNTTEQIINRLKLELRKDEKEVIVEELNIPKEDL